MLNLSIILIIIIIITIKRHFIRGFYGWWGNMELFAKLRFNENVPAFLQ